MEGKVILITGGAKRVGAATCRRLHARGANLVVHYRASAGEARALQAELNQVRPGSVTLAQADLLDIARLPDLIAETMNHFGKLDALVNNASSFFPTPLGEITEAMWDDLIGSNLKVPLFLSQAAAPQLRKQHGCIVNIVDIHAEWPLKRYVIYNAAKGGLAALTRSLAQELGPEIRVNGISPGPILWPENGEWKEEAVRRHIVERTLLKRTGEPDDIARTVAFLIADAPYITGQIIAVDGGRSVNL
ncbi:pteridine reductase [Nitrosospira lacus]|uniref:Pteridine reductase n=1 Tax=Nitrosospira lacus TaxID=1288494 RepID=A0A1W6SMC7_9PROT|nr:pteridine reductase [Nitrosospira lacus]ARO86958.1 pteridine reductase [Nitrosospira lacus]